MERVKALHAPEPYDIDWNYYARKYKVGTFSVHILMCLIFWIISPAITYFCEKELSYGLARAILTVSEMKKKLLMELLRILIHSCLSEC